MLTFTYTTYNQHYNKKKYFLEPEEGGNISSCSVVKRLVESRGRHSRGDLGSNFREHGQEREGSRDWV